LTLAARRLGVSAVNWRQDGQDFQDYGGRATLPRRHVCNWGRAAARPYHESRCLVGDSRRSALRFLFVSVADFLATKGPCGRPLLIEAGDFVNGARPGQFNGRSRGNEALTFPGFSLSLLTSSPTQIFGHERAQRAQGWGASACGGTRVRDREIREPREL